jgi:hypothetical protein
MFRKQHVSKVMMAGAWLALAGGLVAASGCSRKLETGYTPQKLSDTPAERRAYYAPRFTPEAAAGTDREDELQGRRLRPGY